MLRKFLKMVTLMMCDQIYDFSQVHHDILFDYTPA